MSLSSLVNGLEENEKSVYLEVTEILLKIIDNVLNFPENLKFRKLRLANDIVSNKLMPAIGVMEYLFALGFEEADDSLILPKTVPLSQLKTFKEELHLNRINYLDKVNRLLPALSSLTTIKKSTPFLDEIKTYSSRVIIYENKNLQAAAKTLLPLDKLKKKCEEPTRTDSELILLSELTTWFKTKFFTWMDKPECKKCNLSTVFHGYSQDYTNISGADRIEVYVCNKCNDRLLFPRYYDPARLLKTRTGRCGEWANCFCLFCRSLGFETRLVLDKTDHLWTEIYSKSLKRWIHCDPCENVIDNPLMYEKGWNKKLSYVIAFSNEEVQDVTWRYTIQFAQVRARRNLCSELDLLNVLLNVSDKLKASLSIERKRYLQERRVLECIEFLLPSDDATNKQYSGRISGSLDWRKSRGECNVNADQYVWCPNDAEIQRKQFVLRYSTARNKYLRVESNEIIDGWEKGVHEYESVIRKVEHDWKMCYLCRTEGSSTGSIKWKFSVNTKGINIDRVKIRCECTTFQNGSVRIILCNEETCIPLGSKQNFIDTDQFHNSSDLTLTTVFGGGNGNEAWQHAQIFRQPLNSEEYLFEIIITLLTSSKE